MIPTPQRVRLLAENLPEHRLLEAIFLDERQRGLVEVSSFLTPDAALGAAELFLLQHPERPVALVLNTGTDHSERIAAQRKVTRRVLSRITPDGWHLALAIPDVDAWVMADSRLRQAFESDETTRRSRYERAVRIGDLARDLPVDHEAIGRAHPEFAALAEFINRHATVPQPMA